MLGKPSPWIHKSQPIQLGKKMRKSLIKKDRFQSLT
jgi:hypothetical protein